MNPSISYVHFLRVLHITSHMKSNVSGNVVNKVRPILVELYAVFILTYLNLYYIILFVGT